MGAPAYSFRLATRERLARITVGLVLAFFVLASCDEVERHRVKRFFFDGVPPLPGTSSAGGVPDLDEASAASGLATGGWYVHKPLHDCTQCHASRRRAGFSREVQLVAQVPQLCFLCHREYTQLSGWVHGPVATGDCAFCHEPHKTRYPALLTGPTPDLCYRCHEPEALALVENHTQPTYARCLECHEAHAGASRYLLRRTFLEGVAGRPYQSTANRRQYEQAQREAGDSWVQGRGAYVMLRTAIDHVEAGRLWEARAYLEIILEKATLSADERRAIEEVLSQVTGSLEDKSGTGAVESLPGSESAPSSTAPGTAQR